MRLQSSKIVFFVPIDNYDGTIKFYTLLGSVLYVVFCCHNSNSLIENQIRGENDANFLCQLFTPKPAFENVQ